ncbi:hypothetical protein TA3x_000548 [Tundrisphaera sp. TA3]|uniref:hypothetical protein n=1 Tax=Tundrisphaera sp. TA3 TaxID=3435775 RepID=UPI003EB8E6EE
MAARQNAMSELVRFWLEACRGCLMKESVPVPVPYNLSDIDFVALRPDLQKFLLPTGEFVGPRLIVEAKDEHDFDPSGRDFGKRLREDLAALGDGTFIPAASAHKARFSMLKQQHFEVARDLFTTEDFDRVFVVHALDDGIRREVAAALMQKRIYWVTVRELLRDLQSWYDQHKRPAGLRMTLVGDVFHLLFGYCNVRMPD